MTPLRLVLITVVVLLALGLGFGYWVMFAPNTPSFSDERAVKIPPGASFEQATDSLRSAGILGSRLSFQLAGSVTGWGRQIKPGHYLFPAGSSNHAMLDKIRKGIQDPIRVTIPPGVRPHVLAAILHRDLDTDIDAFLRALKSPEVAASAGTDTTHFFGFMRPNTYDIYWTTPAAGVATRLKNEWDRFWTDEMQHGADNLGLSKEEVLTLASIVEWEARLPEERPRVAGVYLNRLLGRTSAGRMRLQADPTVQFALAQADGGPMRRLLFADYQFPHPYNTYMIDGLPPGPINNPSESSIRAVVDAEEHDFLFFVARGDGSHVFSRTFAEHSRAAQAYRSMMQQRRREQAAAEAEAQTPPPPRDR